MSAPQGLGRCDSPEVCWEMVLHLEVRSDLISRCGSGLCGCLLPCIKYSQIDHRKEARTLYSTDM